jgi:hypothetical protein
VKLLPLTAYRGPVHVTVAGAAGRRQRKGIVIHRSRILTGADVQIRDAIPVTKPERTLMDLRRVTSRDEWEDALDRARVLSLPIGDLKSSEPTRSRFERRMQVVVRASDEVAVRASCPGPPGLRCKPPAPEAKPRSRRGNSSITATERRSRPTGLGTRGSRSSGIGWSGSPGGGCGMSRRWWRGRSGRCCANSIGRSGATVRGRARKLPRRPRWR